VRRLDRRFLRGRLGGPEYACRGSWSKTVSSHRSPLEDEGNLTVLPPLITGQLQAIENRAPGADTPFASRLTVGVN